MGNLSIDNKLTTNDFNKLDFRHLLLLYFICTEIVSSPVRINANVVQNCKLCIETIDKKMPCLGDLYQKFDHFQIINAYGYMKTLHTDNIKENLFYEHFGDILLRFDLKQNLLTKKLELIPKSN